MNPKIRLSFLFFVLFIIYSSTIALADIDKQKDVTNDSTAILSSNMAFVSLDILSHEFGVINKRIIKNGVTNIFLQKSDHIVEFTMYNNKVKIDSNYFKVSIPPFTYKNKIFVPVRLLSNVFEIKIIYLQKENEIILQNKSAKKIILYVTNNLYYLKSNLCGDNQKEIVFGLNEDSVVWVVKNNKIIWQKYFINKDGGHPPYLMGISTYNLLSCDRQDLFIAIETGDSYIENDYIVYHYYNKIFKNIVNNKDKMLRIIVRDAAGYIGDGGILVSRHNCPRFLILYHSIIDDKSAYTSRFQANWYAVKHGKYYILRKLKSKERYKFITQGNRNYALSSMGISGKIIF